ncbi:ABC transporter substrate-binding protein [Psychromonas sp. B3M02]|uniref:transporter substrate-binding domain-containing protein n=1 Tax=Psychromonas sp. B3M02 TaxID=2267226 RepID=UPI000DE87AD1|nr:transporter substrate-binding domain-containing protein [Psychromonas sp. B3M02]RBW43607.1 ABC transporter substrate-binding protein [Psychromonas sp. B3M02]
MVNTKFKWLAMFLLTLGFYSQVSHARDLAEIKADGVLRHIGIPYANFINIYKESDKTLVSGLDVELMQRFAEHLGLRYQFVEATWHNSITLLTGRNASYVNDVVVKGHIQHEIKGDILATGATILPWRKEVVDFSTPYFPSAVWLMARADSTLKPITPSDSIKQDIKTVKGLLKGREVLAMKQTCLDPDLYNLYNTDAKIILPVTERKLSEMIPAILNNDAELTLLDVPDILIALEKWPGKTKVIGPISENQEMGVVFRKDSPNLRNAFNLYLKEIQNSGEYNLLVKKYYPSVFYFYPDFFNTKSQ